MKEVILNVVMVLGLTGILVVVGIADGKESKKMVQEAYEKGYLDACKDSYQNKLRYELKENSDGSKTWQLKEKTK